MYRTTDYAKVQKLASTILKHMHVRNTAEHKDGEWFLTDTAPSYASDVIYAGSDGTSLYYAYEFGHDALEAIANANDDESSVQDAIHEIEADIYTADLTAWLADHVQHVAWLDEALSEFGTRNGFTALAQAQSLHKQSVADAVLQALMNLVKDDDVHECPVCGLDVEDDAWNEDEGMCDQCVAEAEEHTEAADTQPTDNAPWPVISPAGTQYVWSQWPDGSSRLIGLIPADFDYQIVNFHDANVYSKE